jgi:hypothetical protein
MVGHREIGRRSPGDSARQPQALEGLRRGHLVDQLAVDIDQGGAVIIHTHQMLVPELVIECLGTHGGNLDRGLNLAR